MIYLNVDLESWTILECAGWIELGGSGILAGTVVLVESWLIF